MKYKRNVRSIALIVASGFCIFTFDSRPAEAPEHLLRKIAQREAETADARQNYTYRQTVTVQEFAKQGALSGEYREVREITFSPERGRSEEAIGGARNDLKQIRLTEEDFADIRNVQPFLFTDKEISLYAWKYKGEETMDGYPCFVVWIGPKQILSSQRFFEGLLWVRQTDFAVVRSEGKAVPQIETLKEQNLFPHFTTIRKEIDGKYLFPVETYADDTLYFRSGPQRMRVVIDYADYKRFGADSMIRFSESPPK